MATKTDLMYLYGTCNLLGDDVDLVLVGAFWFRLSMQWEELNAGGSRRCTYTSLYVIDSNAALRQIILSPCIHSTSLLVRQPL
jgi:hypothetical protein